MGAGAAAYAFVEKLNKMRQSTGYHVVGYVDVPGENRVKDIHLPVYTFDDIAKVCEGHSIENCGTEDLVFIALITKTI